MKPYIHQQFLSDKNSNISYGFFTRQGGVSDGIYGSLNCGHGSADQTENVVENRSRVAGWFGKNYPDLLSVSQVHGKECLTVTEGWDPQYPPQADAMVTDVPDIILGILTADCGPVLFYTEEPHPIIGAAHAGWGGAVGGILDSTVQAMEDLGAARDVIKACVGPCIGPASYEVSAGFERPFLEDNAHNEHFFRPAQREGHMMFDLPGYIAARLSRLGLKHIVISGEDTYADLECYFSYRRTTHRGEPDYGRQVSAIMIKK